MRDMSSQLPTWAWYNGYRLYGEIGTFGDLYLVKDGNTIKVWSWFTEPPPYNICLLDELLTKLEEEQL